MRPDQELKLAKTRVRDLQWRMQNESRTAKDKQASTYYETISKALVEAIKIAELKTR